MSRMSSKVSGGGDKNVARRGGGAGCRRNQQQQQLNNSSSSKCVPQNPSKLPLNPPSSPVPVTTAAEVVEDIEDDDLDVDVEVDDDEQPLDDLDDLAGDNDDPDENSVDLNHQVEAMGPENTFAPIEYINSSSEEEDDDGEADESLDRDESDDEDDDDDEGLESSGFLLPPDGDSGGIQGIPPDAQARLEAFFEAAGNLTGFTDGKLMSDPENLRKLTLTVSSALGEASAAINRMRDSQRKSLEEGRNDSMEDGDSLLALACSSGYFELARVLLAMGANVDDRGAKGDLTPLMDAASQGHVEIVRLLVSHGADVNAQSACGNSPLMYACAAGHEDIVRELLKHGARVEDNNENGHTPLMEAASAGHVGVAKILLDHGAGINTHSNEFKESALTVACYKGHLDMVRFLLEAGADQQHKTDEMHTALMEASMDGHVEVARLLLDSGAQVNMPADSFESPLTLAACGGHVRLAELLIERGANIEEVNDEGYTPLMEAAREGHLSVVKCLLKNSANINAKTEETHETALTLAACGGFRDVVEVLVDSGADIELGASTPLMEASQEGHYQVVKYLLEKGGDVNKATQTGDTALSYACENGHVDVVELLIEKGADHEKISEGGRTPLMKACRGGHLEVIKYLISKGVDINRQTDTNDHTPLSLACAGGHVQAVEALLAAGANVYHKLKDNSTMIIEAARGGHTNVIKVLLDHAPSNKQPAQPKVACKHPTPVAANAAAISSQGKSVLKKTQSTPALDSATHQQVKTSEPSDTSKTKVTTGSEPSPVKSFQVASDGSKKQAMSLANSSTPVLSQAVTLPTSEPRIVSGNSSMPARKQATPSGASAVNAATLTSCPHTQTACSPDCLKLNDATHQHLSHAKRPAGHESVITSSAAANSMPLNIPALSSQCCAGTATSSHHHPGVSQSIFIPGSLSGSVALTSGPPLVPSQVTAQTAISERPKAKANKPSARKQQQLFLQQLQQQQQLLQQSSPTLGQNSTLSATATSPSSDKLTSPASQSSTASTNSGSANVSPVTSPTATQPQQTVIGRLQDLSITDKPHPSNVKTVPTTPTTKFLPPPTVFQMQVQQVSGNPNQPNPQFKKIEPSQLSTLFAQQPKLLKGNIASDLAEGFQDDKLGVIDFTHVYATGTMSIPLTPSGTSPLLGSNVAGSTSVPTIVGSSSSTTTTTTVVVTHGNGDIETLKSEDLPAGANEMILTAAAAASQAMQMGGPGGLQFHPYTSGGPSVELSSTSVTGISMATTTMQTTTIINAATATTTGSPTYNPPVFSHPPPLPQAFREAAASAGLVPPSGAPPPGALKMMHSHAKAKETVQKSTTVQTKTASTATVATQAPCSDHALSAHLSPAQTQKKPTNAKRNRPAAPAATQLRQSTQKVATSQTTVVANKAAATQSSTDKIESAKPSTKAVEPKSLDVDSATETNGETSLSIAAASGHLEVVEFLLSRKADIEHRDKKGCTPLILAADGGHEKVVELLLEHGADIEAQSERTKDTALSLACTKGRYEVVDLLLKRGANKEHRNVSDYTPLSLAASGGYVAIIKLLLQSGAEINSRTGSKLGISPLMLAAMNGNTSAVKLLLDQGSDINAQIETNKNTALTLACFQGRQEVVQLLLDRKANLEHRAKTGLTPLMEAANGGYVEVGKILIEKGADVNAPPVPATRDTALTIAADKGHYRFVEVLLMRGAHVDARNKKGCTPLWLACHGGHLDVAQILMRGGADMDAQDNRRISCLMAAFRKGRVKVIRWIVKNVLQFPSDAEMLRYIQSVANEPDLLKHCQQCADYIRSAKDKQALEANKNASILLEELESERSREESKRMAAARRREKKKKKKLEKKQLFTGNSKDADSDRSDDDDYEDPIPDDDDYLDEGIVIETGIDANSQGSISSVSRLMGSNVQPSESGKRSKLKGNKENVVREYIDVDALFEERPVQKPAASVPISVSSKARKKKKKASTTSSSTSAPAAAEVIEKDATDDGKSEEIVNKKKDVLKEKIETATSDTKTSKTTQPATPQPATPQTKKLSKDDKKKSQKEPKISPKDSNGNANLAATSPGTPVTKRGVKPLAEASGPEPLMAITVNPSQIRKGGYDSGIEHNITAPVHSNHAHGKHGIGSSGSNSGTVKTRKDEGWKEVTRSCTNSRSKKINVPSSVISRVIGRAGCNINAIREATGAHIEVEKQVKNQIQPERVIQIKGSADCVKQAHNLITVLMNEPDTDLKKLLGSSSQRSSGTSGSSAISSTTSSSAASTTSEKNTTGSLTNILSSVNSAAVSENAATPKQGRTGSGKQPSSKTPASPPILPVKTMPTASPSIKKPTPIVATAAQHSKSGSRKQGISNSAASANSFASKLGHPTSASQPIGTFTSPSPVNHPSRTITPTPVAKTVTPPRVTPTVAGSPPPVMHVHLQQGSTSVLHQSQPSQMSQSLNASPTLFGNKYPSCSPSPNLGPNQDNGRNTLSAPAVGASLHPNPSLANNAPGKEAASSGQLNGSFVQHKFSPVHSQSAGVTSGSPGLNTSSLAPGSGIPKPSSNVIGGNRPSSTNTVTSSDAIKRASTDNTSGLDGSQTPLEYSPFNYTFSKTAGWFPGDLANPMTGAAASNGLGPIPSHLSTIQGSSASTHALASSGVARAMNFASVAASGISTSVSSTTTAQITQANGNGTTNVVGSLVASLNLAGAPLKDHSDSDLEGIKAEPSKAPGYRGSTTMGSPILRSQQQQGLSQHGHSAGVDLSLYASTNATSPNNSLHSSSGHSSNLQNVGTVGNIMSGYAGSRHTHNQHQASQSQSASLESLVSSAHNMSQSRNGPSFGPQMHGPGQLTHSQNQAGHMHGALSHPDLGHSISSNNNSMMYQGNRLNSKVSAYNVPKPQSMQSNTPSHSQTGPLGQNMNPSMNGPMQQQNNNFGGMPPAFKNMGLGQQNAFGRPNRMGAPGGSVGNWSGYQDVVPDHVLFQNLTDLAAGAIDPQGLLSSIQENQNSMKGDDRRLPRPIGGERGSWKAPGSAAGNLNLQPYMDCLDTNQIPSMQMQQGLGGLPNAHTMGSHANQSGQPPWLGMYPGGPPQQQQFSSTNPVQHMNSHEHGAPRHRNILGRRFIDDLGDTSRLLDMQQMLDQRMLNGTGTLPPLLHMAGQQPPLFPLNMEHLDHPKLDQPWDTGHINTLDEKHTLNWGKWN